MSFIFYLRCDLHLYYTYSIYKTLNMLTYSTITLNLNICKIEIENAK